MPRLSFVIVLCSTLLAASRAWAVVEAEMPLAQLVRDSHVVAVARLEQVDVEKAKGVLIIERVLRGEEQLPTIPIRLLAAKGGEGSPRDMLERVENGTQFVLFLSHLSPTEHQIFAYSNGSWFKLRGVDEMPKLKGLFVQGEPYLRRTYHGEVDQLVKSLDDFTAGTATLPELDKTAKPGLGPTLHGATSSPIVEPTGPDQIEFGPAWQNNKIDSATPSNNTSTRYAVFAVLLLAAAGLVFMLTRSSPEVAT